MNRNRLQSLKDLLIAKELDGVALVPGPNMNYLAGIHSDLSERPIVLFITAHRDPAIIIPTLEAPKAIAAGMPDQDIFSWGDDDGYRGAFQEACTYLELAHSSLGVEAEHMRVLELELLKEYIPGLSTVHVEPIMSSLRQIKDKQELEAMERAVEVAESAMQNLLLRILIGQSEKQIAAMLMHELAEAGSESLPFDPIVAAGPNGASPHIKPSHRPIASGDLLVIDWGATVNDYPSDITRTFGVGQVNPKAQRIHQVVEEANGAAREVARPGVTGRDIDRAARSVIEEAGYGKYFTHRTGHGLGLEVHEAPYIMSGNIEPLMEGAVFTIEPGIYLPDHAGVRIEDNVVLTEAGCRSLTTLPRNLITVG